jgi:hypothetical protein
VIEQEARAAHPRRITNIEPWRKGALAKAYQRVSEEGWEQVEDAAIHAQGKPAFED